MSTGGGGHSDGGRGRRVGILARHVEGNGRPVDVEELARRAWPDAASAVSGCGSCGCGKSEGVSPSPCAGTAPATPTPELPLVTSTVPLSEIRQPKIRTADQYIASLRNRKIKCFLNGELLDPATFVDHPIVWPSVNSLCETYRLAEERPELGTAISNISGVRVSRFLHIAESTGDLVLQSQMQRELGRRCGCCFQRCVGMDAINACWSTTFEIDEKHGTSYHTRFQEFIKQMQELNGVIGGAMTDPKGDRNKAPTQQEHPDFFVHVSGRKADGSVLLRGAKVHQTGTLNSHYMLVMPGGKLDPSEKDYAICCAVPVDAPGLTYIYGRQSCDLRAMEGSEIDQGNPNFGAQETVIVFDDVEVKPDMIFMDGEIDFTQMLVERFTAYHRRSYICKAGLSDVMLGAGATIAEYNGAEKASHIKDKLVEISYLSENIAGTALAASYSGFKTKSGNYLPDILFANICKHNVTRFPYEIARLVQDIAGGLLVTLPADKDFNHEVAGPLLEKFLKGKKGVTVENRRRILRLIENLTMGRNAIGFLSESMHGAGSPQAQRVLIQRLMNVEMKKKLAKNLAGIKDD
jgi:4-hydroxybutyryl-CoA dehydratase/vinylacetyl-CoA-Delta-isomerase